MPSREVAFETRRGQEVRAVLDEPDARQARAYAIFVHCFGVHGEASAAAFAKGLMEYGLGVLRIDAAPSEPRDAGEGVDGAGEDESGQDEAGEDGAGEDGAGEDEVVTLLDAQDVIDAAEHLRASHGSLHLLVGHSLAGAVVLQAAAELKDVRAVASMSAPSDPAHMMHLLEDDEATIASQGEAHLWLAGQFCRLRGTFLDAFEENTMRATVAGLRRPLLVLHSPLDNTIGIDNARRLFEAARHPKSFVSLHNADHELSRPADAEFAGELVGAWAAAYLPPEPQGALPREAGVAYVHTGPGLRSEATTSGFALVMDEPVKVGGTGTGPNPYDLLSAALAGCTSMTLRLYADRKEWPLEGVTSRVTHAKVTVEGSDPPKRVDRFEVEITLEGPLDDEQRERLLEIAHRCPVHRTLTGGSEVSAKLV